MCSERSTGSLPAELAAERHRLADRLIAQGRRVDARQALSDGGLARSGPPEVRLDRLRVFNWLNDIPSARESFEESYAAARHPTAYAALFDSCPALFGRAERCAFWWSLRSRLALMPAAVPGAAGLALRCSVALGDYERFLEEFNAACLRTPEAFGEVWGFRFGRLAATLRRPAMPDFNAPKVFGIGLTKTGTTSLSRALERLGYLDGHFLSPFSREILSLSDFPLLDSATDTPVCLRFETLYQLFPAARFILLTRPLESWRASFDAHFERWFGTADFAVLRRQSAIRGSHRYGADHAAIHAALYWRYDNPRAAHDAYMDRVEQFFADKPAAKLLRFDISAGDGWEKLCGFLGLPIPEAAAFPWENRTARTFSGSTSV